MNDDELLELAAKAAAIPIYKSTDGTIQNRPVWVFAAGGAMGTMPYEVRWNPLVDDCQALRLAVKCKISFWQSGDASVAYHDAIGSKMREPHGNDPYADTRRAIVRVAAEIGKAQGDANETS